MTEKKKRSTSQTGNDYQDWCVGVLKEWYPGAAIHNQKARAMFLPYVKKWVSQRNDIFGCIDIMVMSDSIYPLYIQCTGHKSFTEKLKELALIPWAIDKVSVQVWMKRESGRTEIRGLRNDEASGWTLEKLGEIRRRVFYPEPASG